MANNNSDGLSPVITNYPLALVIVGTILNFFTFIILCRSTFKDATKRPTLHYMRVMAIFDILMLYGWNLDHYLSFSYGYTLLSYSIPTCKFFTFLNYFTLQVSAWIRVFICLDRYLSLSRLHKTWFSYSKNVLIIIGCIISFFVLLNLHIPIAVCYFNPDGTVNQDGRAYSIYPSWDYVNIAFYNCIPFIFMFIFNSGVIYHLIQLRRTSTVQNSRIHHHSISITLVITTFLFIIMTIPGNIGYAVLYNIVPAPTLRILDFTLYTYHILSFPLYMITFNEFRKEVIRLFTCNKWRSNSSSSNATGNSQPH